MKRALFLTALTLILVAGLVAHIQLERSTKVDQLSQPTGQIVVQDSGGGSWPLLGIVEQVSGKIILVKDENASGAGAATTVQITDSTRLRKQEKVDPTDIKVGTNISAIGHREGNVIQLDFVEIKDSSASADKSSTPARVPGGTIEQVIGRIERVNSRSSMTVKKADGSDVAVTMTPKTQIFRHVDIQLAEIQSGKMVMVTGFRRGNVFQADQVQLILALQDESLS